MRYELYDGRGLKETRTLNIPQKQPTELEIRLAALEKKAGITKADTDAAKVELERNKWL